ncbi:T-cell surface antigen CD2-like isoform X2 [Electrophorus electricus]|uniref:T-cell surface antigen CD2-like isoform X2 n=1 Tax=Electrophorus electricus TaxID=8005 RepID=UPI0015CFB46D|nr:T-cell surface antigen CD2-like isoform X2 [Electrophorus electricus]
MLQNLLVVQSAFLFLSCALAGDKPCIYKAVGDDAELHLGFKGLDASSHLTWYHNQTRVYYRKSSTLLVEEQEVASDGTLTLENIQLSNAGHYRATVFNKMGVQQHSVTVSLCVLEPLSEPSVTLTCAETGVTLTCAEDDHSNMSVSWSKNRIQWKSATTAKTLTLHSSVIGAGENVSCTVSNRVSAKTSKEVALLCPDTGDLTPHPSTLGDTEIEQRDQTSSRDAEKRRLLFGMDFWTIVAIVSGGALVLLVLLGVCTCACYIHTRKHRRQRVEEEHRLATVMPSDQEKPHKSKALALGSLPAYPPTEAPPGLGHTVPGS